MCYEGGGFFLEQCLTGQGARAKLCLVLKAEEKRVMVLMMMFEIEWIESGWRQRLYMYLDMAGEEAPLVSISSFD